MKKLVMFGAIGIFAISLITACGNSGTTDKNNEQSTEQAIKEEKEEWNAKLKDLRARIDQKIDNLNADMKDASEEQKIAFQNQMDELREWGKKVDQDIQRSSADAKEDWKEVKSDIKQAFEEIERDIKD